MSLPDAVTEIAAEMEKRADDTQSQALFSVLMKSFARELRTAVKASATISPEFGAFSDSRLRDIEAHKFSQEVRRRSQTEETFGERLAELVGGAHGEEQTLVPIANHMPAGAKTFFGGEVYILGDDGKLHFSQEETQRYRSKVVV